MAADRDDEIDLARLDEQFAEAPVEEKDFGDVPDGKYQVAVDRVEITASKRSKVPMLKWGLKILDGKFKGRLLWRNSVMASPQTIAWLKTDLHLCGLDLQRLSDLPAQLERLLDVQLEITKRTKGEFENVYFNKRLAAGPTAGARAPDAGGGADDDIPF
jgi:hypothetical protein